MKISLPGIFFAVLVLVLLLFYDCGGAAKGGDPNKVFRLNELGAVTSLDPARAGSFENDWVLNQLYNGLVEMDTALNIRPCIAKSWTISDDGLDYTFHLRTDVCFPDNPQFEGGKGRRVTADDFVFSFTRLFDPKVSNATTLVAAIERDSVSGKTGISAVNDSTLLVHLKKTFRPFLGILTMKYFSVVPKEVVQFYGDGFGEHPLGTGAFMLKTWNAAANIILEKNPNYFKTDEQGVRLPYLDYVYISFVKNPESAFLQFMDGNLDMLSGIDAINKEKVLDKSGKLLANFRDKIVLQSQPFLKTDYLGIQLDENLDLVKKSPLRIKFLREAINASIDRAKLVRYRRYNLGTPATAGFIPPGMHAYDPKKIAGYSYDPGRVQTLLDMAGFPNGKKLKTITLTTTSNYLDIADEVVNDMKSAGIPAQVDVMDPTGFKTACADNKLLFFRKSWIGDYPDPENFMSLFYSKNYSPAGANYTHFHDSNFDRLYEHCRIEQNDSVRADLFVQMENILADQSPVVPLYYDQIVRLVQKNVSGLVVDPTNTISLDRVKKVAAVKQD